MIKIHKSQSLLNEVFFPTNELEIEVDERAISASQSLLNEVFFPTTKTLDETYKMEKSRNPF